MSGCPVMTTTVHLLPSCIQNVQHSHLIVYHTLLPVRVFNCRVIFLNKMTLIIQKYTEILNNHLTTLAVHQQFYNRPIHIKENVAINIELSRPGQGSPWL